MNILEFENVSFSYDGYEPTISNLSFAIDTPKYISIIGASGSGKTTIFKLILSLISPQYGKIYHNGNNIDTLNSYAGYMPQKDLLFPWKNIKDNICVPMDIQKFDKFTKEKKVDEILKDMNLQDSKYKFPYELSGGMRQRISFARTILTGSDLLLFDEPLSALDYITRIQMQQWLIDKLNSYDNKTAIFITHDVEEAIFLSDEILLVEDYPITKLSKIDVPLPKKRNRAMLDTLPIIQLKEHIIDAILRSTTNINTN